MRRNVTVGTDHRGRVLDAGMLAVLLFGYGVAAVAQTQEARYAIEQPSQGLAESLRSIARQTGTSILFDPAAVNGHVARPVSGRLSAVEAIVRVLDGTGLTADVMKDGAVVVRPVTMPSAIPTPPPRSTPLSMSSPGAGERPGAGGPLVVAQAVGDFGVEGE